MLEKLINPHPESIAVQIGRGGKAGGASGFPLLNLVWLFWTLAWPWFAARANTYAVVLTYFSVIVFLALYFRAWYGDRARIVWNTVAMAVLGLALVPVNNSWSYIIYACVLITYCTRTTSRALFWLAVVLLAFGSLALLCGYPPLLVFGSTITSAAIAAINLYFRRNHERDAELRLSHEEVRRLAATAERERIGRDLHDLLGHTLSLIAIKSELADKLFERDPAASRNELRELHSVARESLAQVRSAVTGIRAAGLAAELVAARLLLESSGLRLRTAIDDLQIPPAVESALALCLRESVTNIHRHADARTASIALTRRDGELELSIGDDGRGGITRDGNGLAGLRERVAGLAGDLQIDSPRGQGTTIVIRVGLPAAVPVVVSTAKIGSASNAQDLPIVQVLS